MSKPHEGFTPPDFAGQTKIVFCNEGNPVSMLLTNRAGRRSEKPLKLATAEAAVAWCRKNGAMLIYFPVALDRN
ncbi:MAG: hypothetical protein NTZ16_12450 [Verrucomicrobia bacterium]|nr:hypothetical protein [Verrucomicrobiota bacterium]